MSFTVYDHGHAERAVHDILYDLVPNGVPGVRMMCEAFDPEEMMWGDLEEENPEAHKVYMDLSGRILDRLEDHDIIPPTREVSIPEVYPEWSDEFWDLLDESIESFVDSYRRNEM